MSETNPFVELARLVAAGIVGGLIATFAAHKLAAIRDKTAGKSQRKRDFLAFMREWKHEIDRWHFGQGGRKRDQGAFYHGVSGFCAMAELIRNDLDVGIKQRFDSLVAVITDYGKLEYSYEHDDLIKSINELIAIASEI